MLSRLMRVRILFLLAIHIPVVLIILFRLIIGTDFEIATLLFTVPVFVIGQYTGSKIYFYRKFRELVPLTSCLVMDLVRVKSIPRK